MKNPEIYIIEKLGKLPSLNGKLNHLESFKTVEYYLRYLKRLREETSDKLTKKVIHDLDIDLRRWAGIPLKAKISTIEDIPYTIVGYKDGVPIKRIKEGASINSSMPKHNLTKSYLQYEFEQELEKYTPELEEQLYGD